MPHKAASNSSSRARNIGVVDDRIDSRDLFVGTREITIAHGSRCLSVAPDRAEQADPHQVREPGCASALSDFDGWYARRCWPWRSLPHSAMPIRSPCATPPGTRHDPRHLAHRLDRRRDHRNPLRARARAADRRRRLDQLLPAAGAEREAERRLHARALARRRARPQSVADAGDRRIRPEGNDRGAASAPRPVRASCRITTAARASSRRSRPVAAAAGLGRTRQLSGEGSHGRSRRAGAVCAAASTGR